MVSVAEGEILMKIVIAPDSFKGSNSSMVVASRIEKGILGVFPEAQIVKIPIADGGEGTVDALVSGAGGEIYTAHVTGPMGEDIDAQFAILDNGAAALEMAASSGLTLVPQDRRNPLAATTYGVGQMILAAIDRGAKEIVIGLGGSSTNDGGAGMAQALGYSLRDENGRELDFGGGALGQLARIDTSGVDRRIKDVKIKIASDVNNPLCGPKGASAIFGPQKGAGPDMVELLDRNLAHYADVVKEQLGVDMTETPGAGAAGGLGFGLLVFCGASIGSGIETMLDAVSFDDKLEGANLCITGEGRIDGQSAFGKVPVGVAGRAKKQGVPVLAIVGGIGEGAEAVYGFGVDSIMSIVNCPMPLDEAMTRGGELIEDAAGRAMRIIKIGMEM
jgi:glycerate kinase